MDGHNCKLVFILRSFMIFDQNGSYTLKPEELEDLLRTGQISITEKEIKGEGRGDGLSKGLILVQTTWFRIQASNHKKYSLT